MAYDFLSNFLQSAARPPALPDYFMPAWYNGSMIAAHTTYQSKGYCTRGGHRRLDTALSGCANLYNAALQSDVTPTGWRGSRSRCLSSNRHKTIRFSWTAALEAAGVE